MTNKSVAILLATYNSSKHLEELIESIISQTYKDWKLVIHDDGSTDNTIEIIENYIKIDDRFSLVLKDKKFGAAKSFMELLRITNADYYFFCDHDDVWLPEKLEKSVSLLQETEKKNSSQQVIVHTDLFVVDQSLKIKNDSFWKSSKIFPNLLKGKNIAQVFNFVTGCTMGFNQKAKDISFPYPDNIPMHDWWINLCVLKNDGIVEELREPLILYRQHGNNEVGARKADAKYFCNKIQNLKITFQKQWEHILFLKSFKGINVFQYYYYKLYYTILRNLK